MANIQATSISEIFAEPMMAGSAQSVDNLQNQDAIVADPSDLSEFSRILADLSVTDDLPISEPSAMQQLDSTNLDETDEELREFAQIVQVLPLLNVQIQPMPDGNKLPATAIEPSGMTVLPRVNQPNTTLATNVTVQGLMTATMPMLDDQLLPADTDSLSESSLQLPVETVSSFSNINTDKETNITKQASMQILPTVVAPTINTVLSTQTTVTVPEQTIPADSERVAVPATNILSDFIVAAANQTNNFSVQAGLAKLVAMPKDEYSRQAQNNTMVAADANYAFQTVPITTVLPVSLNDDPTMVVPLAATVEVIVTDQDPGSNPKLTSLDRQTVAKTEVGSTSAIINEHGSTSMLASQTMPIESFNSKPEFLVAEDSQPSEELANLANDLSVQNISANTILTTASKNLSNSSNEIIDLYSNLDVQHASWGEDLGNKILWMLDGGIKKVALHLTPRELGPLEIQLNLQDDQAMVTFLSHNAAVKDLLEQSSWHLQKMFAEQGLSLGQVQVDVATPQFTQDNQGFQMSDRQTNNADRQQQAPINNKNILTPTLPPRIVNPRGLIDYYA